MMNFIPVFPVKIIYPQSAMRANIPFAALFHPRYFLDSPLARKRFA